MKQEKRKNMTAQPYVDKWDEKLYDELLRDTCTVIVQNAKTGREYRRYIKEKKREIDKYAEQKDKISGSRDTKERHNRKGMFGIIANITENCDDVELAASELYARLRKMHDNRTAFRLVDLHEIFLCLGKTPNALFKLGSASSELNFLEVEDIEELESKQLERPISMIVRCVPLLGLSLVVDIEPGTKYLGNKIMPQNLFSYTIVDSLEIFMRSAKDADDPKQITPPIPQESQFDPNRAKSAFDSASGFFSKCITLAKGIVFTRNSEKQDYFDFLLGDDPEKYCLVIEEYERLILSDSFETKNGLFETVIRELSAEKQSKEAERERIDSRPDRAYNKSKKVALDISTREAYQRSSTPNRQRYSDIIR